MLNLLKKPYPFHRSLKENSILLIFVSLFVVLFLWVFQPLKELIELTFLNTLGYGFITFVTSLTIVTILPLLAPNYHNNQTWNVGKEILRIVLIIISISVANYFYSIPFVKESILKDFSINYLLKSITTTLSIGIIPIIIIILYNQNRLLKKHLFESSKINDNIQEQPIINSKEITFNGEGKTDQIQLITTDILYIKSDGNYCEFITKNNKHIIRCSLAKIVDQLIDYPSFLKVHRSYIVNTHLIHKISGNAQGYKVHFSEHDNEIPVSRNNSAIIQQYFT